MELAEFHARYADLLLRDLRERPVSLVRGPDGIGGELFFQKHAARLKIPGIVQLDPALDPGHPPLLQIRSAEALVGAVQMGSIEFHYLERQPGQPGAARPFRPRPPTRTRRLPWKRMLEATQLSLTLLDELGLRAFLKTSGGKGMHLLVPLERRHGWDEVRISPRPSPSMARLMPERFSAVSRPRNRVGKIFVDYLRNSRGASTVAAYSGARPRRVAGVGTGVPRGTRLAAGRQPMEPAQSAAAPRRTRRRRRSLGRLRRHPPAHQRSHAAPARARLTVREKGGTPRGAQGLHRATRCRGGPRWIPPT
ncbi:hypothetical protein ACPA9J_18575 [Pseudomonas aeruginosa]